MSIIARFFSIDRRFGHYLERFQLSRNMTLVCHKIASSPILTIFLRLCSNVRFSRELYICTPILRGFRSASICLFRGKRWTMLYRMSTSIVLFDIVEPKHVNRPHKIGEQTIRLRQVSKRSLLAVSGWKSVSSWKFRGPQPVSKQFKEPRIQWTASAIKLSSQQREEKEESNRNNN